MGLLATSLRFYFSRGRVKAPPLGVAVPLAPTNACLRKAAPRSCFEEEFIMSLIWTKNGAYRRVEYSGEAELEAAIMEVQTELFGLSRIYLNIKK
jgi:hypothetical protein